MDPADILIIVLAVLGGALPIGLGSVWYHYHRRVRSLERELRGTDSTPDARLEGLERAVDTLSAHVEELATGQDFLNRLLTKQRVQLANEDAPRVITPH